MRNLLAEKNQNGLAESITIYVPTTNGAATPASEELINETLQYVQSELAQRFGGFTTTKAVGGWYSEEEGRVVKEEVYMVRANAEELSVVDTNHAVRLAEYVKTFHNQEAVSLDVSGTLYFI